MPLHLLPVRDMRVSRTVPLLPLRTGAYALAVIGVCVLALCGSSLIALPALGLVAGWSAAWSP